MPVNSGYSAAPPSKGTPTHVASASTYEVPADTQVLVFLPIQVDGVLKITGDMVML